MPRDVKRLPKTRVTDAWDGDEIERFVAVTRDHRWGGPILLQLMYGLRRSELLALHWSAVDLEAGTVAIVAGLVESDGQLVWSDGKNARSRRRIALDPSMTQTLREHRRRQAAERIRAGEAWEPRWPTPRGPARRLEDPEERCAPGGTHRRQGTRNRFPGIWLSPLRSKPGICSLSLRSPLTPSRPLPGTALIRATDQPLPCAGQLIQRAGSSDSPGAAQRSNTTRSRSQLAKCSSSTSRAATASIAVTDASTSGGSETSARH